MLVQDIMHSPVVTVTAGASLAEAYRLMQQRGIRHLPVVQDGQLRGIVTDRDLRLATSALHPHPFPEETRVVHVMAQDVVTAAPLDPVEEAARLMRERAVGCLPVLHGDHLVGIVTGTDLLDAIMRLTGLAQPTGRLAVQLADEPGQLAKLTALLAAREVNIHSVLSYPRRKDRVSVVLRVNTLNTEAVAEALRVAGFEVVWPPAPEEEG